MVFFSRAILPTPKDGDFYSQRSNNDHGYKKKMKQVQETNRFNCKAQIIVKEILEFQDHKVRKFGQRSVILHLKILKLIDNHIISKTVQ